MSILSRTSLSDGTRVRDAARGREVGRASDRMVGGAAAALSLPRCLAASWPVSVSSLLASEAARGLVGALVTSASSVDAAAVVWRVERGVGAVGWRARCGLELVLDDGRRVSEDLGAAAGIEVRCVCDGEFASLDASGLTVVLRAVDGSPNWRLVYARTDMLRTALGLPGGVYDQPMLGLSESPVATKSV